MKKQLLIPIIVAALCTGSTALLMQQCSAPQVREEVRVVQQRIEVPGQTVTAPGRTIIKQVADTTSYLNNLATIRALRAQRDSLSAALQQYETTSATALICRDRMLMLRRGSDTLYPVFTDCANVSYDFPPLGEFRHEDLPAEIELPDDSTHVVYKEVAPPKTTWDYVLEGVKILAGVAVGYFSHK